MNSAKKSLLSLRDPDGTLVKSKEGRLLRFVPTHQAPTVERILADQTFQSKANLIPTYLIDGKEAQTLLRNHKDTLQFPTGSYGMVLEHEPVFFPSYPSEWCTEALIAAGLHTLHLAQESLKRGWGLKEATPYNILFEGTRPVFVDWLSIELRNPGNPTWLAFKQYVQCFLLPLWMDAKSSLPLNACYLSYPEGLTPEQAYALVRPWQRFAPSFFPLATVSVWLGRRKGSHAEDHQQDISPKQAKFILNRLINFLKDRTLRLDSRLMHWTPWSGHLQLRSLHTPSKWNEKKATLSDWLGKANPKTVLDVGCKEGWFSELAAQRQTKVIAIDSNREMVRRTWSYTEQKKLDIQALHVDLCRPTPAMGWKNHQTPSFLERAQEKFDLVAAIDILPKLSTEENISYDEIFSVMHGMTRKHFFVEFVDQRNAPNWDQTSFLSALKHYFRVVEEKPIQGNERILYWLEKKQAKRS